MQGPPQDRSHSDWSHSVFGLISPDAVRRHLAPQVLSRLEEVGVVPTGWRSVRIGGAQIDAVADIQQAGAGQTFRYRPLDALFRLGPAIALRLGDRLARTSEELYADIIRVKGRTTAGCFEPGTIRHDLGLINAVLSLVHLSDSPTNAALESRAILGAIAEESGRSWAAAETLAGYLAAAAAGHPVEGRGFTEVLSAVRARVVAVLWTELSDAGRRAFGDLTGRGALADAGAGELLAAELSAGSAHHPLAAVLRMRFDPAGAIVDIADVQDLLHLYGCALDPWEYVVLATSIYFEPVRASAAQQTVGAAR
jgi:nucleoside diphosphate kinase